jgi:hypothetical protein
VRASPFHSAARAWRRSTGGARVRVLVAEATGEALEESRAGRRMEGKWIWRGGGASGWGTGARVLNHVEVLTAYFAMWWPFSLYCRKTVRRGPSGPCDTRCSGCTPRGTDPGFKFDLSGLKCKNGQTQRKNLNFLFVFLFNL